MSAHPFRLSSEKLSVVLRVSLFVLIAWSGLIGPCAPKGPAKLKPKPVRKRSNRPGLGGNPGRWPVAGDGPAITAANGLAHGLSIAMSAIVSSKPINVRPPSTSGQPHPPRSCLVPWVCCRSGEASDSCFALTRDVAHGACGSRNGSRSR